MEREKVKRCGRKDPDSGLTCSRVESHPGDHKAKGLVWSVPVVTAPPSPPTVGLKDDAGKAPWHLFMWRAANAVVHVLEYGARKYAPNNWRNVPHARQRYFAATMRHLVAWHGGENIDPESGLPHLAHAACSLLFILELESDG